MDFRSLESAKKIWVFGYSNLGRNAFNKFMALWPEKTAGILVTNHNEKTRENKKNVVELQEAFIEDSVVVIATNSIYYEEIRKSLIEKNAKDIFIYTEELDEILNGKLENLPLIETKFFAVCVGQACNYKCRDCINFAPYAKKENRRYSIEQIKDDLERVMPYFAEMDTLHIQGGEPFIYSELPDLVEAICDRYGNKVKKIQIATNGSIVPSKEVLEKLADMQCIVRISNYKREKNVDILIEKLQEFGIKFYKYDFAGRKGEWSSSGGLDYVSPENENLHEKVRKCKWSACYMLEDGMIGRCARSIPARTLQNIIIKEGDYINVREIKSILEMYRYFMFINPIESCKRCKGSEGEPIMAAIQIGEEIE